MQVSPPPLPAADTAEITIHATSPEVYDSRNKAQTYGVNLVNPAGDQMGCSACVPFVVASAAESAMASVLRMDVSKFSISKQALFLCSAGGGPAWTCETAVVRLRA